MGETKLYSIIVQGCDDSTRIEMELTLQEYELVKKIADKITETSTYSCMPRMTIEELQ